MTNRLHAKRHKRITGAVHDAGGAIALQVLHAGRYGYHPLSQSRVGQEVADHAVQAERHVDQEVDRTVDRLRRSAAPRQAPATTRVEIMGSEGYLSTSSSPRAPTTATTSGAARPTRRMRFPVEVVRRTREPVGADFPIVYRFSLLDLVEGGQTWDEIVELAHARRPASPSSTPASAGTRRGCPRSSPRCRAARGAATTARSRM